jgi:pimeloyl-ACP methyl ester carboxylesterase
MVRTVRTDTLEIAYEESGNPAGPTIVLVHGWPDDVRCWDRVVPDLVQHGLHVFAPYLRGFGPTRFLSPQTMRSGQIAAFGNDVAQFLEHLDSRNVLLVGHDWGARAGYVVGALYPERLRSLFAMSAGYATDRPSMA